MNIQDCIRHARKRQIHESKVKSSYSSRRQESHVQRRRVTGAGAGARGCGPHHPPVSRKSPARDESSFGCVVQTRQFFVRFLFEVCWLLSFFSPEVPVQGELVRARGFRSRAFNSALARLAGCRARGGLPTRAPRPDDSRQVSGFAVAPLSWLCV